MTAQYHAQILELVYGKSGNACIRFRFREMLTPIAEDQGCEANPRCLSLSLHG
jgi:hypothetical protein